MAKIGISSTDLVWVFHQRLEAFDDASRGLPIAIVPAPGVGWTAILGKTQNPHWARRVEGIQKQLRDLRFERLGVSAAVKQVARPSIDQYC